MKITRIVLVLGMVLAGCLGSAVFAQDPGWPRQLTKQGTTLVYYQPQVDDWTNFTNLSWRMAVLVTSPSGKQTPGVVVMQGVTNVDMDNQMVYITNLKINNTYFPSLDPAAAARMNQVAQTFLPPTVTISLPRLVACVPKKGTVSTVQLNNTPPAIFISYRPAILLGIDGQPVRAPIEKTKLEYVVNTQWPLFFDTSKSEYILLAGQVWMEASDLHGPWSVTYKLPRDMEKLPKQTQWADLKGFIPPPLASSGVAIPTVLYSTVPADVILFNGQPVYSRVTGTALTYAINTNSFVFVDGMTNQFYYLTAGRWFSAGSLTGPWTFATSNLPADFARIPPTSPAAEVLASVPGTDEARNAVLLAQIPTTVIVDPSAAAAQANATYDGAPQFAPIQGTSLAYATNTPDKIIQNGSQYYLCQGGIWFVSYSPQGPWQTAGSVPQVIYTIPPSSPVYNVTYVTQVTTSTGVVQSSYTAGYFGAFVMGAAVGAVIAGGTGYYYPPYVGVYVGYGYPHYYATPYTYGAGAYYRSPTGAYGVSQTAYGPYGSATRTASYNPYTGTYTHTASASTAYGKSSVGTAYNPYTGASAATHQSSNAYSQWGSSAVSKGNQSAYTQHYSNSQGTVASAQGSNGGKAVGSSTAYGNSAAGKTSNGDMYAGHDGNVYKNTGSGWQKYDNGSWNDVNKPTQTSNTQQHNQSQSYQQHPPSSSASSYQHPQSSSDMQGMQREAQNRQRGEQASERSQSYQRSRGWGGGGGRSWGGRR